MLSNYHHLFKKVFGEVFGAEMSRNEIEPVQSPSAEVVQCGGMLDGVRGIR